MVTVRGLGLRRQGGNCVIKDPRTWHYGVIARYWAQFNVAGPEIEYFQRYIERYGEPALDVACGTGRLLIPYLHAGLDVDGCDISPDMLALCRERAEREGLKPNLYAQAVHDLSSQRKYKTIIFCGGFGVGGYRAHDLQGLRRIHQHLEPGGVLVMDTEAPYASPEWWAYWTKDERRKLPEPWGSTGQRRRGPDGLDYMLLSRVVAVEPIEQRVTLEMHAQLWKEGDLFADEKHEIRMTMYFKDEILLMLDKAGFSDVRVLGHHNDAEPTSEDDFLVFIATR
jgi:SAM-dependent methyltransferase